MAKKNLFLSVALVCAASLVGCGGNNNSTDEVTPEKQPPVEVISTTLPIADPYVLLYDGTYYAYGTSVGNGERIRKAAQSVVNEYMKGGMKIGLWKYFESKF